MRMMRLQLEMQLTVKLLTIERSELITALRREHTVRLQVVIMDEKIREVNGMIEETLIVVEEDRGVGVGIDAIDGEVEAEVVIEVGTEGVTAEDLEALQDTDDKLIK